MKTLIAFATGDFMTKQEIAKKAGISVRTVERIFSEFGVDPVDLEGSRAIYSDFDVERALTRHRDKRLSALKAQRVKKTRGIITIREAKRLARGGRAK